MFTHTTKLYTIHVYTATKLYVTCLRTQQSWMRHVIYTKTWLLWYGMFKTHIMTITTTSLQTYNMAITTTCGHKHQGNTTVCMCTQNKYSMFINKHNTTTGLHTDKEAILSVLSCYYVCHDRTRSLTLLHSPLCT